MDRVEVRSGTMGHQPDRCDGCVNAWPLLLPTHEDRGVQVWHERPDGDPQACIAKVAAERRASLLAELRSEKLGGPSRERVIQIAEALAAMVPQAKPHGPMVFGSWPERCEQRAFVDGAAWWEFKSTGGTMWSSDRALAEAAAVSRFGEPAEVSSAASVRPDAQARDL